MPPSWDESAPSGATKTKAKTSGPAYTEKQVLRLAGRLIAQDPTNSAVTQDRLGKVFAGYSPGKVNRLAKQVGLPENVARGLSNSARARKSAGPGGVLGGFLQAVGAPGQAVLGGISEGSLEGVKKGLLSEEEYTPVQAFSRGILGQSKKTAQRTEAGLGGWALPINFAGSVATDPLTYVSFGTSSVGRAAAQHAAEKTGVDVGEVLLRGTKAFTKAQRAGLAEEGGKTLLTRQSKTLKALRGAPGGVKIGGKTVVNTRKLSGQLGERFGKKYANSEISKAGDVLESMFRTNSGLRQAVRRGDIAPEVLPKFRQALRNSEGRAALGGLESEAKINAVLKDAAVKAGDLGVVRNTMEGMQIGRPLTAAEQQVSDQYRGLLDEFLSAEQRAGYDIPRRENYVFHQQTGKKPRGTVDLTTMDPGFAKGRRLEGSIEEVNRRAGREVFNPNLQESMVARGRASAQAVEHRHALDELTKIQDDAGVKLFRPKAAEEQIPLGSQEVKLKSPDGVEESYLVSDAIAPEFKRYQEITSDPGVKGFLNTWDKVNQIWRQYAVASPGFIARNEVSNVALASYLPPSGFRATVNDFAKAAKLQLKLKQGLKSGDLFAKLTPREAQEVRDAFETGALSGGFFRSQDLAKETGSGFNPAGANFGPTRVLRNANEAVENNSRLALFLHNHGSLGKNGAADVVDKYLFNYRDLTHFEQAGVKRVSPFYCVPEEAEILTQRGWLIYEQLVIGEPVLVLDPQTHEYRWEPLLEVATFPFNGELKTIKRRVADIAFTNEHRWPYEVTKTTVKGKVYGGQRGVKPASELNTSHLIPTVGKYHGQGSIDLSPRHAAILGWVVTDGHSRWRGNYCEMLVYQSPAKFLNEIVELLGTKPRKPHPLSGVVPVGVCAHDVKVITKFFRIKADMPGIAACLSAEAAEAMYQAMFNAEGHVAESFDHFAQQDGPVLDAFQILCALTGRSAWKGTRGAYVKRGKNHLKVSEGFGTRVYRGVVWCPRTPTGTWVMRQGGAYLPTGNTWIRKNLPLQLETAIKTPGRFSRVQQTQSLIGQPSGLVPSYLQGQVKVGDNPEKILGVDLPWNSAAQAVEPIALLAGVGSGGWRKAVTKAVSNNTGGALGFLYTAALAANGKDPFTGADLKKGSRVDSLLGKIDPALLKTLEAALPALQRAKAFAPQSEADQSNQNRRLLSWLTGLSVTTLNEKTRNTALYELLDILKAKQQTLKDTGKPIPNLLDIPGYQTPKSSGSAGKKSTGLSW